MVVQLCDLICNSESFASYMRQFLSSAESGKEWEKRGIVLIKCLVLWPLSFKPVCVTIVESLAGMAPLLRTEPISLEMLTTEHVIPIRLRTNSKRPSMQMEKKISWCTPISPLHMSFYVSAFLSFSAEAVFSNFRFLLWLFGEPANHEWRGDVSRRVYTIHCICIHIHIVVLHYV